MRRHTLQIIAAGLLLVLLAACSKPPVPKGSQPQPLAEQAGGIVTLRVATPQFGGYGEAMDAVIAGFQESHPQYRVAKVPMDSDAASVVVPAIQDAQLDVAFVNAIGQELIQKKLISDLEPYINKTNMDLDKLGMPRKSFMWTGKTYVIPVTAWPRMLVANVDMFAEAGVPLPTEWTWDQFRETARKLTHGSGEGKQWGAGSNSAEILTQLMLQQKAGNGPAWKADEAAVKEAFQFWSTVIQTDRSVPAPPKSDMGPYQRRWEEDTFANGRAAMALESLGGWASGETPFKVAILPMPTFPGARAVTQTWYYSLAIPANSPQPDAAWEFIRYAVGPEGALLLAKQKMLPMYVAAEAQEAWSRETRVPGAEYVFKTVWTSHGAGEEGAGVAKDMQRMDIMNRAINAALTGAKTWEEAATDFFAPTR